MRRSLASDAKDALAGEVPQTPEARAEYASALFFYAGACGDAQFHTGRAALARLLLRLVPGAHLERRERGGYTVMLPTEVPPPESVERIARRRDRRRLEFRAAFLVAGSYSATHDGYHLEFALRDEAAASRLAVLFTTEEAPAKRAMRRGRPVLYLKDGDAIAAVLTAIGAYATVLRHEDLRAVKETKNRVRRLVNTEAANVDRTIAAAATAREAVEKLRSAGILDTLSPTLREAAQLRLAYPSANLAELAEHARPRVTKSTFADRIATLIRLAAERASP